MATIREIEIFLKLAEELHFGRTAVQLGITQAALSKEIGKLETSLDCRLFDRSDKWHIQLTAAGKAYLQEIKSLPMLLNNAREHAQQASRGESGTLVISVANLVYDHLHLGDILRKMHEKYPAVKLMVRDCQNSPQVYGQVLSGQTDIGFLAVNNLSNMEQGLQQFKLLELPISLAVPGNHQLAQKDYLRITDLKNVNFILPPAKNVPWLRQQFDEYFFEHCGSYPVVEQEALGLRAIRQLVSAGLGIGLTVKPGTIDKRENIVYKDSDFELKRIVIAAWNENTQSRALKNFLRILKKGSKRSD